MYFYIGRLSYLILYFDPMVDSALSTPVANPVEFLLRQDAKLGLYTKIDESFLGKFRTAITVLTIVDFIFVVYLMILLI